MINESFTSTLDEFAVLAGLFEMYIAVTFKTSVTPSDLVIDVAALPISVNSLK